MKATQPREKLQKQWGWVEDFSDNQLKGVGVLEFLAAVGLMLPAVTGILTWLTPLAAVGLILLMIGGGYTHYRRNEISVISVNVVFLLLALGVAYIRFFPEPL